jgi:type II secretory pathway pseudopilin PulG
MLKSLNTAAFLKIEKFKKLKNSGRGITLVEVLVVIFIIALFSAILVSDFPRIKRQFALSRATYKLSQDLRRAEDLGLSGVKIIGYGGQEINAKGYGVYIDSATGNNKEYIIYADRGDIPDAQYDRYNPNSSLSCSEQTDPQSDCIIEIVEINKLEPGVVIKGINNATDVWTSINFSPPNPTVTIINLDPSYSGVSIIVGLDSDSATKSVYVNTSGLIEIK